MTIQAVAAVTILFAASMAASQTRPAAVPPVSFYKEVFPIFRSACAGCHNGDTPAGGLNLTSYLSITKGGRGGPLFIAGKSADSRLIKYLTGTMKPQMPPGGGLKPADVDRIRSWIDGGARVDTPPAEAQPKGASKTPRSLTRTVSAKPAGAFVLRRAAPVTALAFGPDGKTLAVGTYREVQFWNVETKSITARWTGHTDTVRGLAYSKDGRWLAAGGGVSGANGEVRLWDVTAGREVRVFGDHTDTVNGVAFSPDGTKIASASSDKTIKSWDAATGKLIATGKDHSEAVWGIAWSPDGKYLASCGGDRSIKIWDAAAMKRLYSLGGHEDVVFDVEFSPDGKTVISASADRTARVWNIGPEGGSLAHTLAGHSSNVMSASFAPTGGTVTGSGDKTVRMWDAGGGNPRTLAGVKDWVYCVRFSRDGKTVAAGTWDGTVSLWTVADGKPIGQLSTVPAH